MEYFRDKFSICIVDPCEMKNVKRTKNCETNNEILTFFKRLRAMARFTWFQVQLKHESDSANLLLVSINNKYQYRP